ncbi:MAG: amidohydrolase [Actinomycetia bacterium]|nr:amidohydrolase [Actinomycetes bacterium]
MAGRDGPAGRVLGDLVLADHSCASLLTTWASAGDGQWPAWRASFTGAGRPASLARDVPGLLGYRHFLTALAALLDVTGEPGEELERAVVARRDELAEADPGGYLRLLLDHAGTAALLVDAGGGGDQVLTVAELERAADRPAHEIVRLETLAEELLAQGAPTARSLGRFVGGFEERVGTAMERGVVALKSIASARGGLWLFTESSQADRRRAFTNQDKAAAAARFEDPVLLPFLVRRAAELAATRQVPLQFSTGIGDEDVYLPHADPGLLWPMLRDPRTEDCPVVLLGCYPYVGGAAHLAGTYAQVSMDLSPGILLAEPIAARMVSEALGLCPPGKLLAGSGGRAYPESHWWGAVVWRRALARVLRAEVEAGGLDDAAARDTARRILATNATRLYRL